MSEDRLAKDLPGRSQLGEASRHPGLDSLVVHLRQVQLYLLLVTLALLLAASLPRDTQLEKAATQLDEVIRFRTAVADSPLWQAAGTAAPEWEPRRGLKGAILFQLPPLDGEDGAAKPRVCFFYHTDLIRGDWVFSGERTIDDFRDVKTHREFAELWNILSRDDAFLRVREYSEAAYFDQRGEAGLQRRQPVPVTLVTDPAHLKRLYRDAFTSSAQQRYIPTMARWIDLPEADRRDGYSKGIELRRSLGSFSAHGALVLPVRTDPAHLPVLNRLLADVEDEPKYLAAEDYLLVHPELSEWTLGGDLDRLDLHSLRSVLRKVVVAQGEKFPIFGLSVPYAMLFKYGLFALLLVQLFFWCHLRSFRQLLAGRALAVWAPWLPLYDNRVSRLLTLCSTAGFPLSVSLLLMSAAEFGAVSVIVGCSNATVTLLIASEFVLLWRRSPAAPAIQAAEPAPSRAAA